MIAVPDDPSEGASLRVPWDKSSLASPPLKVAFGQDAAAGFAYQEIADALRVKFRNSSIDATRAHFEGLVVSAQALADDTNPDVYKRRFLQSGTGNDLRHAR